MWCDSSLTDEGDCDSSGRIKVNVSPRFTEVFEDPQDLRKISNEMRDIRVSSLFQFVGLEFPRDPPQTSARTARELRWARQLQEKKLLPELTKVPKSQVVDR